MKRYPYVILGGSIAAVAAIEGIRSKDRKGEILVVGEEPCKAYGRPLISYYLLGETDLRSAAHFLLPSGRDRPSAHGLPPRGLL